MKEQITAQVYAADEKTIEAIAKKRGIPYPNHCLGFFQSVYAKCEEPNKNRVRLNKDSVIASLNTLVGTQCNLNHFRKGFICGTILDAWMNESDEIVIAFSFFKDVYSDEWERAGKLLEQGKLSVSFELWADPETAEHYEDGTRRLNDIQFIGVGLLLDEKPAYPGAKVFQMAKEAVINLLQTETLEPMFAKQIAADCADILADINKNFGDENEEIDAKKLTTEERKALPDDDFAVVIMEKKPDGTEKKIRKFPIHDESHVRSALQRLSQDKVREDLRKLGVDPDEVLKKILLRAKKLGMNELLDRHSEDLKRLNIATEDTKVKPEVMCEECQWTGMGSELVDNKCPKCNSDKISEVEMDEEGKCKPKKTVKAEETTTTVVETTEVIPETNIAEVVVQENVNQQTTTVHDDAGNMQSTTVVQTQTVVEDNGQPVQEEQTLMIRMVKYTMPQLEEKMATDEANIKELTTKLEEATAKIEELNKSVESIKNTIEIEKANAVKIYQRKLVLDMAEWKDEDYLNDEKFEMARLKKENEELKAKVGQPSKPETVTAVSSTVEVGDVKTLATGHTEDVVVGDVLDGPKALRSAIRNCYKNKK